MIIHLDREVMDCRSFACRNYVFRIVRVKRALVSPRSFGADLEFPAFLGNGLTPERASVLNVG